MTSRLRQWLDSLCSRFVGLQFAHFSILGLCYLNFAFCACSDLLLFRFVGHVRQLVDSLPYKEEVRGSSPFVPTNFAGS